MKTITAILLILLIGCAGSPAHIAMMSPEGLTTRTCTELCNAYAHLRNQDVRKEIERRCNISIGEWNLIDQKRVSIGMSEDALVCSWGYPGVYGDVNESVGIWGKHKQWVYNNGGRRSMYVYTQNGKVTSWQK